MAQNKQPKISIVSPSYNHQNFIGKYIKSILSQTYTNFELIIVDDFSNDKTLNIVKKFSDSRIKIIKHEFNMGPSLSFNDGINAAQGEYIAFIATDDETLPTYLEKGIDYLDNHKETGAICFQLTPIDKNSNVIQDKKLQQTLKFINIKHFELLQKMFTTGNMTPSPGEIIRKSILKNIGQFNPSLLQTQDYDFHTRTLFNHNIFVYQEPLIKYRILNNKNIDNGSYSSLLRKNIEVQIILDNYLTLDTNTLTKIFPNYIKKFGQPTPKTIPYFLARVALSTKDPVRQQWGYLTLIKFIKNKENLINLHALHKISFKNITALINNIKAYV